MDNVFVERLWRTVKYEDLYLHDYATVRRLEKGLAYCLSVLQRGADSQCLGISHAAGRVSGGVKEKLTCSGPNRFEIAQNGDSFLAIPPLLVNQQPRETFGIGLAGC